MELGSNNRTQRVGCNSKCQLCQSHVKTGYPISNMADLPIFQYLKFFIACSSSIVVISSFLTWLLFTVRSMYQFMMHQHI
jgi:hypothetical protein